MRFSTRQSGHFVGPAIAISIALLLSGCQSGGTAVSSYNGNQFADAIASSQKNFNPAMHDRDAPGSRKSKAVSADKVPVPGIHADGDQTLVQVAALDPNAADAADVQTETLNVEIPTDDGPTLVAALRSEPLTTLPGVGDPFAQVTGEQALPSTRPDAGPSKREINGADMPLLAADTSNGAYERRAKYASIIRKHAQAHGVPVKLAMAVVQIESMYRPGAVGSSGEIGLMQILPRTARYIGYTGSMKALHDPETNISYGMKYLGKAHRLGGGSTCGTILKYNAGHGAKKMNSVSREYCRRVSHILQET